MLTEEQLNALATERHELEARIKKIDESVRYNFASIEEALLTACSGITWLVHDLDVESEGARLSYNGSARDDRWHHAFSFANAWYHVQWPMLGGTFFLDDNDVHLSFDSQERLAEFLRLTGGTLSLELQRERVTNVTDDLQRLTHVHDVLRERYAAWLVDP